VELMRLFKAMYERAEYKQRVAHYRSRMANENAPTGKHEKVQKRDSKVIEAALKVNASLASSTVDIQLPKAKLILPKLDA
jgi:hypothetical protein